MKFADAYYGLCRLASADVRRTIKCRNGVDMKKQIV